MDMDFKCFTRAHTYTPPPPPPPYLDPHGVSLVRYNPTESRRNPEGHSVPDTKLGDTIPDINRSKQGELVYIRTNKTISQGHRVFNEAKRSTEYRKMRERNKDQIRNVRQQGIIAKTAYYRRQDQKYTCR
jgi:hypothetical protein